MKKILVGAVTRAAPNILEAHLRSIRWQRAEAELELYYIADPELPQESHDLLREFDTRLLLASEKPEEALYEIDDTTHHWNQLTFGWLAKEKQRLLDLAAAEDFDAVWLVDSDLLCDPGTLDSLLACQKEVVSGVFYTKWQPEAPPLPQCWLQHPYGLNGLGLEAHEYLDLLANRGLVRVAGLGACTLIRSSVLPRVAYWPLVEGLPSGGMWQGEDRHFCVRAERQHIGLYADAWPDIFHVYRPQDEALIPETMERLQQQEVLGNKIYSVPEGKKIDPESLKPGGLIPDYGEGHVRLIHDGKPRVGDLVSFTLEACEEPQLVGRIEHVRGRLGQIRLAPDLERVLLEMTPGDERFERINFPLWYPLAAYRGSSRILRIRLLAAKPYSLPPSLDEEFHERFRQHTA